MISCTLIGLRAMVDKSTDYRNDVMVRQFVFHILAHSIFPETSTEMVVKNCQCYCEKQIDNNFSSSVLLSTI